MGYSTIIATAQRQIANTQQSMLRGLADYSKYAGSEGRRQPGFRQEIRSCELRIADYLTDAGCICAHSDAQIQAELRQICRLCRRGLKLGKLTHTERTFTLGPLLAKFDVEHPEAVLFTGEFDLESLAPFSHQRFGIMIDSNGKVESSTIESCMPAKAAPRYSLITPQTWPDLAIAKTDPQALALRWSTQQKLILAQCPQARILRQISLLDSDEIIEYFKVIPAVNTRGKPTCMLPEIQAKLRQVADYLALEYQLLLDDRGRFPVLIHFVEPEQGLPLLDFGQGSCRTKQDVPRVSGLYAIDPALEQHVNRYEYTELTNRAQLHCLGVCQRLHNLIQAAFTK